MAFITNKISASTSITAAGLLLITAIVIRHSLAMPTPSLAEVSAVSQVTCNTNTFYNAVQVNIQESSNEVCNSYI